MIFEIRKFKNVPAFTEDTTEEHTLASGEKFFLREFGGEPGGSTSEVVTITWDPGGAEEEILYSTNTGSVQNTVKVLTGNGARKIRITLDNNSATSKTMGGYLLGKKDEVS